MAVRRAPSIPAPFKREGIEINDGSAKRTWQDTPIDKIQRGDLIRDFGVVGELEIQSLRGSSFEDQIRLKAVNAVTGDVRYWTFDRTNTALAKDRSEFVPTLFSFSVI